MTKNLVLLFVFLAGAVMSPNSQGADVTVKAVDGRTGRPLAGYVIRLDGIDAMYPEANTHPLATATTGSDGTATLHLDEPLPKALFIVLWKAHFPRSVMIDCARPEFSTDEVLRSGVVGRNACDPAHRINHTFSAGPGQVVVFARKKGFLESFPG